MVEEGERKREFRFVSLMNHGVKLIFVVFFSFFFSTVDFNDSCNYFNGCR